MHSVETVPKFRGHMWLLGIKPLKTSPTARGREPTGCSPVICRQQRTETCQWVPVDPKSMGTQLSLGLSPCTPGSSRGCSSSLRGCTGAATAAGAPQGLHDSSKWPPPTLSR